MILSIKKQNNVHIIYFKYYILFLIKTIKYALLWVHNNILNIYKYLLVGTTTITEQTLFYYLYFNLNINQLIHILLVLDFRNYRRLENFLHRSLSIINDVGDEYWMKILFLKIQDLL